MKHTFTLMMVLLIVSFRAIAQIPPGYYDAAAGKSGTALQQALHDIIDNQNPRTYNELWTDFQQTDVKSNGKVWDIYSDNPTGTPPYEYTFISDQCGSYSGEGDCYNREHSFPKSWFNDLTPMYTDLFHLYPTDGYVNGRRSNYPYGEVSSASWTSQNGSRLGNCAWPGYSGTVFEPIDAFKGDLARTYFYMATRYYGEDASWPGSDMVNGSQPKPWARTMLVQWAQQDPVSQKEIDRNNKVYSIQNNRNPFIDHPEYANMIFGPNASIGEHSAAIALTSYPNPAVDVVHITLPPSFDYQNCTFSLYTSTGGQTSTATTLHPDEATVEVSSLPSGLYLFALENAASHQVYIARILKR